MFEVNAARRNDPAPEMEFNEDQGASLPVEKLPLLLGVLLLSALAGGSTAWIVFQIISFLRT